MKPELKLDYYPGQTGEFIRSTRRDAPAAACARSSAPAGSGEGRGGLPPRDLSPCAECGACWNVCAADAVDFGEPRGGTGVRFLYG